MAAMKWVEACTMSSRVVFSRALLAAAHMRAMMYPPCGKLDDMRLIDNCLWSGMMHSLLISPFWIDDAGETQRCSRSSLLLCGLNCGEQWCHGGQCMMRTQVRSLYAAGRKRWDVSGAKTHAVLDVRSISPRSLEEIKLCPTFTCRRDERSTYPAVAFLERTPSRQ